jgi:sulfite reductase (ferredoxin)
MYQLPPTLSDDIAFFGSLVDEFNEGKIENVRFKAIRVPMGIYEQRKDGTYMVRIRCAGGYISPSQLKKVAETAIRHKSDLMHITTRQEIQIQNADLSGTPPILQNLKETGLSSKGGGGNTVRNIMVSLESGISTDEVFDVLPYASDLTSKLIAEPDSFTLPRKFKIAFSNSDKDTAYAAFNDLGFIARIKDGKKGFKVYLGGSLATKPTTGYKLFDFAPEEDLYYITDAAKKLFSRYGNRKNKHQARLRYVFYKLGKEEVFRLFFEIYNELKQAGNNDFRYRGYSFKPVLCELVPESASLSGFDKWKDRYVKEQRQDGLFSIMVPFSNGNARPEIFARIADFASNFGDDVIRFSMRQNIHLRNIPEQYLGNVFNFLTDLGTDLNVPYILNTIVSCTGANTCRLGICLSKGAGSALRKALEKSDLRLDLLKDIKINISGCPNSCGQQVSADLGFYGKVGRNDRMFPAYHVVAGASTGAEPKIAELICDISAYDLPSFTVDVLRTYQEKQNRYKSFCDYFKSEGKSDISGITLKYRQIPEFHDNKNYYFDWGGDQIFSLAARGVGECSAGLFDMIDVDLATINSLKQKIAKEPGTGTSSLLYGLVFASSRMLLITRGAEPRNEREVFNDFIEKFIDTRFVSNVYREIIEIARDNQEYDFSEKKETIIDLSEAVVALYEGMDDSLQFRGLNAVKTTENEGTAQKTKRKKDLRGVICPMNFVRTKIELSSMKPGDILEILLDDGEPVENVPGSIKGEGHKVLDQKKIENYWSVTIEKS